MNLTIFEKIKNIFSYSFSSFLSIELLIFSILLLVVLIVNLERGEKIVTYSVIGVYLGLLIGTLVAYNQYVLLCIREFFKVIVSYICFPTTITFFATICLITIIMIYTLFSRKLTKFKKIFNYVFFSILYYFFMSFIALTAYNRIDLNSLVDLYSNNYVLVIVQGSNVLLLIWFIYTFFYKLYLFFKKEFD